MKLWLTRFMKRIDTKFSEQFGFCIKDTTCEKIVDYLHTPKDASSLAVTRILFGLAMLFDIPDERGGADMENRWGDPMTCHFPLVPFVKAIPMPYMALVYAGLWFGAIGITLGYRYRLLSTTFAICYWYLFLIEKSYWNNHSYLFGLVSVLLAFTKANCRWSLDVYRDPSIHKSEVPYWNYFILKYQFFILYFVAGLKKGTAEWLTGYSVQKLSEHWVFTPFTLFLTVDQTDYLIVHWFAFIFDLTVAIWMMLSRTRHVAMVFCAMFHLMNSRLFRIGMFPWVCLATMPLFYPFDWPMKIRNYIQCIMSNLRNTVIKLNVILKEYIISNTGNGSNKELLVQSVKEVYRDINNENGENVEEEDSFVQNKITPLNEYTDNDNSIKEVTNEDHRKTEEAGKHSENVNALEEKLINDIEKLSNENNEHARKLTCILIGFYIFVQAFLPYSHFITKGYNNWTNGLYGYSWDMMVQTWEISSVVVKVVDKKTGDEFYVDPNLYTPNDRWNRQGDMVQQYANCLKDRLTLLNKNKNSQTLTDFSIYVDVWCSVNGRFTQRIFNPKIDVLQASWTVFDTVPFLMPLMDEALHWRKTLSDIREEIYSQSTTNEVIFLADFPGYDQERFIPIDLTNVTLTVLEGSVSLETETDKHSKASTVYKKGHQINILPGSFHKVINVGDVPAFYMYTYTNATQTSDLEETKPQPKLPIGWEIYRRFSNMIKFTRILTSNIIQIFFHLQKCNEY